MNKLIKEGIICSNHNVTKLDIVIFMDVSLVIFCHNNYRERLEWAHKKMGIHKQGCKKKECVVCVFVCVWKREGER